MHEREISAAFEAYAGPERLSLQARVEPRVAVGASNATIELSDGRLVVDMASGGFGYGHPEVLAAVGAQIRVLPLSNRLFGSRPLATMVRRLATVTPGDLAVTYPCNSRAEAVEGALKLALGYRRSRRIVATDRTHHGATLGALGVSGADPLRGRIRSFPVHVVVVPYGDLDAIAKAVDRETAAVVLEPLATGIGVRVPSPGYLRGVRDLCDATGSLLIADEVATGLGRTGELFAAAAAGVVPDVLVLGGALGGGVLPSAAYVAKQSVNDRVYGKRHPAYHATTTGGNPLACVTACAVLDALERERLVERAAGNGRRIARALERWSARVPEAVVEHAGRGLVAAIRLADAARARELYRLALAEGVLLRLDESAGGEAWLGLRPPLLATPAEVERGLDALERTLTGAGTEAPVEAAARS